MNEYIPLNVLDAATKELINEATKLKKGIDISESSIRYEGIQLKETHSGIPMLYKIALRYPKGPVDAGTLWGVWTEKGQRIQIQ